MRYIFSYTYPYLFYAGMGLNTRARMAGSDMYVGWVKVRQLPIVDYEARLF